MQSFTIKIRVIFYSALEDQFTNLVMEHQLLPGQEIQTGTNTSLSPSIQLQFELSAFIRTPSPPRGPPPPYTYHPRAHHAPIPDHLRVLPSMLEEDEEEDVSGGHFCRWLDCGAVYGQREELVKHLEKIHVDQRKGEDFTCFWAGCPRKHKPFNARYKLLIHMRVHSGEKPNKCSVSVNLTRKGLCVCQHPPPPPSGSLACYPPPPPQWISCMLFPPPPPPPPQWISCMWSPPPPVDLFYVIPPPPPQWISCMLSPPPPPSGSLVCYSPPPVDLLYVIPPPPPVDLLYVIIAAPQCFRVSLVFYRSSFNSTSTGEKALDVFVSRRDSSEGLD